MSLLWRQTGREVPRPVVQTFLDWIFSSGRDFEASIEWPTIFEGAGISSIASRVRRTPSQLKIAADWRLIWPAVLF